MNHLRAIVNGRVLNLVSEFQTEPVVTVALAALLFGEALSPLQWAGGVAILAAVLALVRAGGAAADDATATSNA